MDFESSVAAIRFLCGNKRDWLVLCYDGVENSIYFSIYPFFGIIQCRALQIKQGECALTG